MKINLYFFSLLFIATIMSINLSSCGSDDNDNGFDYPLNILYGTWEAQEVQIGVEEKWYDVTKFPYTQLGGSITFYDNGSFYGTRYFGDGAGTYKAIGNKIITYMDGKEYITYTINSLSENFIDFTRGSGNMRIKAKKN